MNTSPGTFPHSGFHLLIKLSGVTGTKTVHFRKIKDKTEIEYADMIFFDDEARNRNVEKELGVYMHLIKSGVTTKAVDDAVKEWRSRQKFKSHFTKKDDNGEGGSGA
jgi:magnesium-dependent phosphatase 1